MGPEMTHGKNKKTMKKVENTQMCMDFKISNLLAAYAQEKIIISHKIAI